MDITKENKKENVVEYRAVSLPLALLEDVDNFVIESRGIYSSRADFVRQATIEELRRKNQEA